ncbi:MAG: hypothetical protein DCC67_13945 [Planctomycetota bacterium]|nr:MAG: hypothetical protein DCC67_13945 [Planctomycetota bacterium]
MEVPLSHREHDDGSWWSRAAGGREVLAIALPMVASTISWTLMTYIDRRILHKVSGAAMSAGFNGSVTWFASLSLLWGICSYTSTFVSQYHGDDQPEQIGRVTWQGVWLAVLFAPLCFLLWPIAPYFFALHSPEVADLETRFFRILCWAAPGMLTAQALEAFYSGRGRTWVVMLVDAVAVFINYVLANVLVLGLGGFEPWGMEGAAWATTAAQWSRAAMFFALAMLPGNRRTYQMLRGMRLDPKLLVRLVRFGGPSGVQMMLDVGGFTIFVLLVGQLGPLAMEATSAAFTVSHVAFMPVWGLGMATVILVGQHLGENRAHLAERATRTTLVLALAYMGAISLTFVLAPGTFLSGLLAQGENGRAADPAVQTLAVHLLRFVAAYNLFDAVAIIFVSALKGAGDTAFIMRTSVVMATGLTGCTWFGATYLDFDVYGCWAVITIDVWLIALVYLLRFRWGPWRSMRVIEHIHHPAPTLDEGLRHSARAVLSEDVPAASASSPG